jgi:hypothetical protein
MTKQSWAETCRAVIALAQERCACCRMHQSLQGATFHIEHIIPHSENGTDLLENLCWACPGCNLHKANRVTAVDPFTGEQVSLFHPQQQKWSEHFQWNGTELVGLTPIARATISVLQLNSKRRQRVREAEQLFQLFPPID